MTLGAYRVVGLLLALALMPTGCRGRRHDRPPPPLVPSDQLGRGFMLRQQITVEGGGEKRAMQAVVQLSEGKLVLVGLGPHGARVMQATQDGLRVEQRVLVPIRLPFTALDVLGDVHRVLFRGCEPPAATEGEAQVECVDHGASVRETHEDGRLTRRSFARPKGAEPHTVITYEGEGAIMPKRVVLDNTVYRYRLTIDTLAQQWLE